ncbi:MAG TPA: SAM-dependent methyltransferase [Candidatus Limnocylindrales bacterium]|nr:SAM-dependent methyltransferase [Candidatus Limnocylindrales bacterium]
MMEAGQRRGAAPPPPTDDPGRPELVALIREEILAHGPITFARFMERTLYEPGLGYYRTSAQRPTRAGDFLTAPELHPIFGHALARQIEEIWRLLDRPTPFVLREHGAGRGSLGASIAEGLRLIESPLAAQLRYEPIEAGDQAGDRFTGLMLANELLDALPVHRTVVRGGRLRELLVDWQGDRFVEVEADPSTPALAEWLAATGVQLTEGQHAEACLAMGDWLAAAADQLEHGYLLLIDYAAEPSVLYGPGRPEGTLRAFRDHHVGGNPLTGVGHQDLTTTVDLGALRRLARAAGLTLVGQTSQAELLVGCGLEATLEAARERAGADWEEMFALRSAVARLLDPRQLGGYAAVFLARGVEAAEPLCGLSFRLPAR